MNRRLKIIVSGGGTGGHIFPAVAIANAIKEKRSDAEFLFVGALGRMEMEKVPAAGYKIMGLWISGLQRSLSFKNLSFPFKVISSLIKAKKILKSFNPDVVIGTGGYASGPMLSVASSSGIPTLIQEQNSFPGITNKLLAKRVSKICVAYNGMEKYFPKEKILITGNPVRNEVVKIDNKRKEAFVFFKLDENKKTVLVIGGSLGAFTINESINQSLQQFAKDDIQLIWQTGKTYFEKAKNATSNYSDKIKTFDFLYQMDFAYAAADVVISRAGAMSVSELCLVKKPVILVPSPNVAEDHQTKNAMALVNKNAAIVVKDANALKELYPQLKTLINDRQLMTELGNNISELAFENAAEKIADEVIKLARA
jgi:UDP-N-acetylglucosamine--N-acetylmuramyl-(pentapeptide) pyrophosphoryl-undecaprenol N-acetylglucosamine transferase